MSTQYQTETLTMTNITFPKRYHVFIHNDDHTPIDFVIQLLIEVFDKSLTAANDLTHKVHNEGHAIVGTYTYELAEQKALEGVRISRSFGWPLKLDIHEDD